MSEKDTDSGLAVRVKLIAEVAVAIEDEQKEAPPPVRATEQEDQEENVNRVQPKGQARCQPK